MDDDEYKLSDATTTLLSLLQGMHTTLMHVALRGHASSEQKAQLVNKAQWFQDKVRNLPEAR